MEHNRKQKFLMIIALVMGIASLSVGFAAFSTSLIITSQASVSPSSDTFSVKFSSSSDSLVTNLIKPSGMSVGIWANSGVIDNSSVPTIKDLYAFFTEPGQYVEYIFYVRNEGEYTAYLNNINYIGNKTCIGDIGTTDSLVQSACDAINITVTIGGTTYNDTTAITSHYLAKGASETIKVRLEYVSSGVSADGPFSVTFPNVALVYSTIDDSTISPKVVRLESGSLDGIGAVVSIGNEKFFVISKEHDRVKLLSMYNLHVGNIIEDESMISVPLTNPAGIQSDGALGYGFDLDHPLGLFPWVGVTKYSNSYAGSSYSGSIVEGYVDNYATYLTSLGVNVLDARLITKNELDSIGCYSTGETCTGAQDWVYSTSYWTMSAGDSGSVWRVERSGYFALAGVTISEAFGVRPLIEIPLSEF